MLELILKLLTFDSRLWCLGKSKLNLTHFLHPKYPKYFEHAISHQLQIKILVVCGLVEWESVLDALQS